MIGFLTDARRGQFHAGRKNRRTKSVAKKKTDFEAKKKSPNPRLRTEENLIAGPLGYFLFLYFLLNYSLASFQEVLFLLSVKSKYLKNKGG